MPKTDNKFFTQKLINKFIEKYENVNFFVKCYFPIFDNLIKILTEKISPLT